MTVGNVRQWLDQSDVDYFTHFVKAWIPFNAWFRHNYGSDDTERDILEKIKSDGNRMRSRIVVQLTGQGPESEQLRNHIAALHRSLSGDPLEDRQKRRIAFENVCVGRNAVKVESTAFYGWTYEVERKSRPQREMVCIVKDRSESVAARITQAGVWDVDAFVLLPELSKLNASKQARLIACYRSVNPYEFRSLLADADARTPIEMDGYRFIDDGTAIFAGLVDVLYGMRNLLFHGELVPDPVANQTYEPAYHLLRHFLKAIA